MLPAWLSGLALTNLAVGSGTVDLEFRRREGHIEVRTVRGSAPVVRS
jgi:hypothetical protein